LVMSVELATCVVGWRLLCSVRTRTSNSSVLQSIPNWPNCFICLPRRQTNVLSQISGFRMFRLFLLETLKKTKRVNAHGCPYLFSPSGDVDHKKENETLLFFLLLLSSSSCYSSSCLTTQSLSRLLLFDFC
jgi:hypothetical protein